MKKLLYILLSTPLLLYSPTPIEAATPKGVDSIYVYDQDSALIFMQEWLYDENGTKTNEVQYTWENGVKKGDKNTFQAYDAKKNLAEDVVLQWDEVAQKWLGDSRTETIYNASNKVARGVHFGWQEDAWSPDSTWNFEYNAQGKTTLTLRQGFHNGEWQDQYKLIQYYDDNKKEIYREEYSGRNERGLIGKTKWSKLYNGSTVISNRQYQWSATDFAFVPKSWDTVGIENTKTVLKMSYTWTNGVQKGKSKEEWKFNSDLRQILNIKYVVENGAFVPSTKQEDEWNGSTNTMTAKYSWDKTMQDWVGTSKTENITTADGYVIKKVYGKDFVPTTIDSTKTANGKKVYYAKWTYSGGVWKGNSREVYAYEGSYQTLQEKYSSWNNGWVGSNGNKWVQIWKGGKVWSKVSYNWSSGWVPSIKDSTEYNGNDITFCVHYKWMGSAWEGDNDKSNYSQTYLSPGQKEWTITLKWENNQWTNFIQTRSIYEGGKLKEERSQQWNSFTSAWQDVKVVTHTWENGVEVFTRTEEWNKETQSLKMTSQYKYMLIKDAQGRNQEEYKMKCGKDSVWVGTGYNRTLWYYDQRGDSAITSATTYEWKTDWSRKDSGSVWRNQIGDTIFVENTFVWSGTDWTPDSQVDNVYDELGRPIMLRSMNFIQGHWVGLYLYEYTYDDFGNKTSEFRYGKGSSGNVWEGTNGNEWAYDAQNNTIKEVSYLWKNNEWIVSQQDEYEYDALSRQTMRVHYYLDDQTWDLVYEYLYRRAYLGDDTTPSSTFQYEYIIPEGQETGDWVVKQEDTYKYDNNDSSDKLREEIHGTWSKGVVIKYERTVYFYHDDQK